MRGLLWTMYFLQSLKNYWMCTCSQITKKTLVGQTGRAAFHWPFVNPWTYALQCRRDSLKQKFNKTYELKHGAFFINGPAAYSEQLTRHPYRGLLSGSYTEATATGVGAPDRLPFNVPSGGKGTSTPPSTEGWPPAKAFDRLWSPDVGLIYIFEDGIHKFPGFVTIQWNFIILDFPP